MCRSHGRKVELLALINVQVAAHKMRGSLALRVSRCRQREEKPEKHMYTCVCEHILVYTQKLSIRTGTCMCFSGISEQIYVPGWERAASCKPCRVVAQAFAAALCGCSFEVRCQSLKLTADHARALKHTASSYCCGPMLGSIAATGNE